MALSQHEAFSDSPTTTVLKFHRRNTRSTVMEAEVVVDLLNGCLKSFRSSHVRSRELEEMQASSYAYTTHARWGSQVR